MGLATTAVPGLASRLSESEFLGTTAWFFLTVNVIKTPLAIGMGLLRHSLHASGILIRLLDAGADFSCVTTTHP